MSFRYLEQQNVPARKTVPYLLHGLRGHNGTPIVHVEHLGESNTAYWLEMVANATVAQRPSTKKEDVLGSEEAFARALTQKRNEKRTVVARHAVRRLENVYHDDGTPALDSDIRDFVFALPDDVFDSLWMFCENPNNFRDYPVLGEPKELAGK